MTMCDIIHAGHNAAPLFEHGAVAFIQREAVAHAEGFEVDVPKLRGRSILCEADAGGAQHPGGDFMHGLRRSVDNIFRIANGMLYILPCGKAHVAAREDVEVERQHGFHRGDECAQVFGEGHVEGWGPAREHVVHVHGDGRLLPVARDEEA